MGCDYYIITEAVFVDKNDERTDIQISLERGYFFDSPPDPDFCTSDYKARLQQHMKLYDKVQYAMENGEWKIEKECINRWEQYLEQANMKWETALLMTNMKTIYKRTYCCLR